MYLKDKVALITGSSGSIGKATAVAFAKEGADIYLHYNKSMTECNKISKEIENYNRKCYLIKADLTSMRDIENMFGFIQKTTGSLDILVNNAGVLKTSYIKSMTEDIWEQIISVNLKSALFCAKYAFSYLVKTSGKIVNISSLSSFRPIIGESCYGASKAGMISLTKSMALEFGRFKINVNAVSSGPVSTNMREIDVNEREKLKKRIPLGRIAEAEDIANAVLFLCSPLSSYITGQVLNVDGGLSL